MFIVMVYIFASDLHKDSYYFLNKSDVKAGKSIDDVIYQTSQILGDIYKSRYIWP